MAGEQVGAHVKLTGDAAGVSSAVNQANNAFATLEQAVATNWWGLQNLGLAFAALPAAIAGGAGVAIAYAREWEDAMFELRRTSGLMGEESEAAFRAVEASIFDVARITPLATSELAALASEGAALGIANESLAEFARVMGLVVASTNLTEEGVSNVARVLNIMQVPQSEFENFASALVEVGRSTAATETDIITAAKRLSTVGSIANVSTPSILGMGAALRSLGPEAEAGATAINKTISDMANAIAVGGDELQAFASISGVSVETFSNLFRKDAYSALTRFITGLGRLPDGAVGIESAFEAVGISATRTKQALSTLANGTRDVGNQQRDLNAIMANANATYRENTVLQDVENAKLQTLSGQLQLLKNLFFETGTALGNAMLGPLKVVTGLLGDLVRGFQVMNPVVRNILLGTTLFGGAILGLAAGLILIGPRIVIAVGALRQLRQAQGALTAAGPGFQAVQNQNTAAIQRNADAARAAAIAINGLGGTRGGTRQLIAAETIATDANTTAKVKNAQATGVLRGLYNQFGTSIRKAAVATVAMTAAIAALTYWTAKQGDEAQKAQEKRAAGVSAMKQDLNELIFAFQDSDDATIESLQSQADALVKQSSTYRTAKQAARDFGFETSRLDSLIKDTGSLQARQKAFNELRDAEKGGSKTASVLLDAILDLRDGYSGVAGITARNAAATEQFGDAAAVAAQNTKDLSDSLNRIAQAHLDYIPALFAQREAELALKKAQDELLSAQDRQLRQSEAIADAERDIKKARRDHQKALRAVQEAEERLGTARSDGLAALADAQDSLADAQDDYRSSLESIADLEEQIAELRAGPTAEQMIKATNDLASAQLRLLGASRKVADAEWYLQYIREQGGSARDVEDAEFALAEARLEAAESQEELSDAEKELADLRDENKRQQKIAKLEREIASSRRDSAEALRDITKRERELNDVRQDVASDQFYKDAQSDLLDAQSAVYDSLNDVRDAEIELGKIRGGSLIDDARTAQLNYERALYNVATANVEVQKQTALMKGETFNAGREASTLADELARISQNIPNGAARSQMRQFVDILNRAPAVPDPQDYEDAFNTGLSEMDLTDGITAALEGIDTDRATEDNFGSGSWWQALIGPAAIAGSLLAPHFSGIIGTALSSAGSALGGVFATVGGTIAAGLLAGIAWGWALTSTDLGKEFQKWWATSVLSRTEWVREKAFDIIGGLWQGIYDAGDAIVRNIRKWMSDNIYRPIVEFFQIRSPSRLMMTVGSNIVRGLWEGIVSLPGLIAGAIEGIVSSVFSPFVGAGKWLFNTGHNIVVGFVNGLGNAAHYVWEFFEGVYSGVGTFFSKAGEWLLTAGGNIVRGLYNGLVEGWNTIWDWARSAGGGFLKLFEKLWEIGSPSKAFARYGRWLMEGLADGIDNQIGNVESSMRDAAAAADLQRYLKDNDLEYLLSSNGFGNFDANSGSARIPNGEGGSTMNYGDNVVINATTNASPEEIVNEYFWQKRVKVRV